MHRLPFFFLFDIACIATQKKVVQAALQRCLLGKTEPEWQQMLLRRYGVLTSPANWLKWMVPRGNPPLLLCWPALAAFALCALGIERLGAARLAAERRVGCLFWTQAHSILLQRSCLQALG